MAKESYTYKNPNGVFLHDTKNKRMVLISDPSTDSKKLRSHVTRIHNKINREGDYKSPYASRIIDTPNMVTIREVRKGEKKGTFREYADKDPAKESKNKSKSSSTSKLQGRKLTSEEMQAKRKYFQGLREKSSTSTLSKMKESFKKAIRKGGGTLGGGGSFGAKVPNKLLNPPYKKLYKGGVVNIVDAGKYFKHK